MRQVDQAREIIRSYQAVKSLSPNQTATLVAALEWLLDERQALAAALDRLATAWPEVRSSLNDVHLALGPK